MEERRREKRHVVTLPVMLGSQGRFSFVTMTKNIASSGMLVMTAVSLEVGEAVTITYRTGAGEPTEQRVTGRIVRVEPNEGKNESEWPYLAAVELSGPQPEIDRIIKEHLNEDSNDSDE
jgi:hypothetical protein